MAGPEHPPQRRFHDDPEVVRFDLLQDLQRIVDLATDKITKSIEDHKSDPYAHQAAAAQYRVSSEEVLNRISMLWDERNEMKGMVRIWLPILGIIGPILSGLVVGLILFQLLHKY